MSDTSARDSGPDNLSEGILVRETSKASGRIRSASIVSRSARRACISFGVAITVLLPLMAYLPLSEPTEVPPQPEPDEQAPVTFDMRSYSFKEGGEAGNGHDHPIKFEPSISVSPSEIQITAAPPVNRDWHRTVLEQGDTFWALPDASFVLHADVVKACTSGDTIGPGGQECIAEVGFQTSDETIKTLRFVGRTEISFVPRQKNRGLECEMIFRHETTVRGADEPTKWNLLTPTAYCKFDLSTGPEHARNLCIRIRRSEHLEVAESLVVALDVQWRHVEETDSCSLSGTGET